ADRTPVSASSSARAAGSCSGRSTPLIPHQWNVPVICDLPERQGLHIDPITPESHPYNHGEGRCIPHPHSRSPEREERHKRKYAWLAWSEIPDLETPQVS